VAPLFGAFEITGTEVAWSTAAGAAGAIGFLFLFEGLSKGRMAVVSPAAAVTGAALPVFAGVLLGERPAPLAWAGILVALPAIWMVSAVGDDSSRRTAHLDYGLLAGVGFGLFFLFMAQTSEASGLWPLVVARGAALMVVAPLAVIRRIDLAWPREVTWQILLVGIGDIAANALFLLAVRSGLISLVAVLSSLYPVVTVLLARLISHEHLRTIQIAGVAMTVVAVAAISAA
jgi:drug/metabolite transporter (DMT)-like permease